MKNSVQEALALAEETSPTQVKVLTKQMVELGEKVDAASSFAKGLYGIEAQAKSEFEEALERLEKEQRVLREKTAFAGKYAHLSMIPLTWRDENGWPKLAVYCLDSPKFELSVTGYRDYYGYSEYGPTRYRSTVSPKLPEPISSCYSDVMKSLRKTASNRRKTQKLSCKFQGLIPADVKEKIAAARADFKKNIFIVAEPKDGFVLNEESFVEINRDPLVVGFQGNSLWLIADFETTTVEACMKGEFSLSTKE